MFEVHAVRLDSKWLVGIPAAPPVCRSIIRQNDAGTNRTHGRRPSSRKGVEIARPPHNTSTFASKSSDAASGRKTVMMA